MEVGAVFKVDDSDLGFDGARFGLGGEFDKRGFGFGEVIIDEIRGSGAEDARDFLGAGDETGEPQGGISRRVFLVIGAFVGFVDDDKAEIVSRGKKSGARTNDN